MIKLDISVLKHHIFAMIASLVLGCMLLFPIVMHPNTRIADDSDGLLGVWTINRVQENILSHHAIFEGDTFYPNQSTLIFSDIFVTSAVLSLPLRLITSEPIVFYSFSVFFALVMTTFACYLLLDEVLIQVKTRLPILSFTLAVVFSLSEIHLRYFGHLHVLALQYVILAMWLILRFLRTQKAWNLILAALLCVLQVWQSFFLVYYVIFFCLGLLLTGVYRQILLKHWKLLVVSTLLFVGLCLPVVFAYLNFNSTYHVVRDIREVIHFSLIFPDLWQQFLSPIVYLIGLLGMALYLFRQKTSPLLNLLFFLAIFGFVICLGPALHLGSDTVKPIISGHVLHVPLPYVFFYYLLPGFKAFRTPSRFLPFVAVLVIALSQIQFLRLKLVRDQIQGICILLVGVAILLVFPLSFVTVPNQIDYPSYVQFISNRPEKVLLKLPIRNWDGAAAKEDTYQMLYNLLERKLLVNGQSGFFPNEWMDFQEALAINFPSEQSMQLIRNRGVQLLLIDRRVYPQIENKFTSLGLSLLYQDTDFLVAHVQ